MADLLETLALGGDAVGHPDGFYDMPDFLTMNFWRQNIVWVMVRMVRHQAHKRLRREVAALSGRPRIALTSINNNRHSMALYHVIMSVHMQGEMVCPLFWAY